MYVRNNPAFVVGLLGAWKAGGAAMAINPMNKARELTYLLADSGATALLCLDELCDTVARDGDGDVTVHTVITCSPPDWRTRNDPRLLGAVKKARHAGTLDLLELIEAHAGATPSTPPPRPGGHPAARAAAVVGVPDEYWGQTVTAFVSPHPGAAATSDELIEYCKAQLAAYTYPRSVELVDELPKTTTGKILRRELRDHATP